MIDPEAWVPLAEIMRPHGVRGEVRLKLFNKDSDVLLDRDEVLVRLPDGEDHEVSVDGARRANEAILLKLHSVDDRDRAAELRGALVCVRRRDFPVPEKGEFYACDVVGARVTVAGDGDGQAARELGVVKDLLSYPSVDVLVVRAKDGGKDWEVPLVDALVASIDVETGSVELKSLEGVER